MINADGTTETGAFDLVPILEAFIATHPDFSYQGARATLAITGYDGIFGYRINTSAKALLGEEAYQDEVEAATKIVQALRKAGYTIACGTYENTAYGKEHEGPDEDRGGDGESIIAPPQIFELVQDHIQHIPHILSQSVSGGLAGSSALRVMMIWGNMSSSVNFFAKAWGVPSRNMPLGSEVTTSRNLRKPLKNELTTGTTRGKCMVTSAAKAPAGAEPRGHVTESLLSRA
jgi:ABC-type transport system substrate-binding protein